MYALAPIIGGFTVAYINSSNYVDNIINAGFASGIDGFILSFIISGLIEPAPIFGGYSELVLVVTITVNYGVCNWCDTGVNWGNSRYPN